jgi:hypothetical protein
MTDKDKAQQVYELLARDHPSQQEFFRLLQHVAPGVLAKRYLWSGLPYVFREQPHKHLAFRETVGRIFGVPAQQIAVMGSARFGFSTSPTKQSESGSKLLDENSDMDLVVISPALFQQALDSFARFCFSQLRQVPNLRAEPEGPNETVSLSKETLRAMRHRSKALTFGYVNPGDLEDGTPEKQHYYDMQREAGTQLFGTAPPGPINRIGARIYRYWDDAERAYEFSFRKLAEVKGFKAHTSPPVEDAEADSEKDN